MLHHGLCTQDDLDFSGGRLNMEFCVCSFIKQKPEDIQAHWKTADTCCTSGQLLYGLQVGFLRFESQHSYLLVLVAGAAIDAFDIYFYFLCDGSQTCLRMIQLVLRALMA